LDWGLGFGVWGLGFGVWGLELKVSGSGFRVSGIGYRVLDLGSVVYRVWSASRAARTRFDGARYMGVVGTVWLGLWVKGRREREKTGYEPFALHAPAQRAI